MPEYEVMCEATLLKRLIKRLVDDNILSECAEAELLYPSYNEVSELYDKNNPR